MTDLVLDGSVEHELNSLGSESFDSSSLTKTFSGTKLPIAVVELLLEKLATDDEYRALFQQNPVAALEMVGATDTTTCEGCGAGLPSKEVIQQTRSILLQQIVSMVPMMVFKR